MRRTVYLAGPILGCTKTEANDWRINVADRLKEHGITGISPLRCEPLIGERYGVQYSDPKFGTARAIGSKNIFDVRNCDLTLAYLPKLPDGRHQSYGTIAELAWAFALGRPAILVTDDQEIAEHPVLNSCAGWLLSSLDDAVDVAIGILDGYCGGKNV
jgi:nucleoside 2-deoxyribosyltransferase